jgi:hypothetical protein
MESARRTGSVVDLDIERVRRIPQAPLKIAAPGMALGCFLANSLKDGDAAVQLAG